MDNIQKLLDHPDVENCHPKFLAWIDKVKVVVAYAVEEVIYLTEEGKAFLEAQAEAVADAVAPEKPAKRSKKTAEVVQSANELVDKLDDLNLSE